MSRDSPQDIPPPLRDALGSESDDGSAQEDAPDYESLWTLLGSARPPDSELPDAEDTWRGVQAHLDANGEAPDGVATRQRYRRAREPRSHRSSRIGWAWPTAMAATLLVAVGAWLWSRPVTVTAPPGSALTRTLPDGSTVELNGGARLTYTRTMSTVALLQDERRSVEIRGEAYFEIQSAERPFLVRTSSARIEVVGTAFSVRTNPSTGTHVALAEGALQVGAPENETGGVALRPGQAVHVEASGKVSAPVDTSLERVTAWRRGGFAITAQPLPAIAEALEKQFGSPVRLSPSIPRDASTAPLTLYYSDDVGIETVLHDISMARGLSYRPSAEGGYVVSAGANSGRQSGASK